MEIRVVQELHPSALYHSDGRKWRGFEEGKQNRSQAADICCADKQGLRATGTPSHICSIKARSSRRRSKETRDNKLECMRIHGTIRCMIRVCLLQEVDDEVQEEGRHTIDQRAMCVFTVCERENETCSSRKIYSVPCFLPTHMPTLLSG